MHYKLSLGNVAIICSTLGKKSLKRHQTPGGGRQKKAPTWKAFIGYCPSKFAIWMVRQIQLSPQILPSRTQHNLYKDNKVLDFHCLDDLIWQSFYAPFRLVRATNLHPDSSNFLYFIIDRTYTKAPFFGGRFILFGPSLISKIEGYIVFFLKLRSINVVGKWARRQWTEVAEMVNFSREESNP